MQRANASLWQNTTMTTKTSTAFILAALAALAPFAIDTYLPAFPVLARDLGGTTLQMQQSLTFYLLPYAVMTLWHGAISDAIGRLTTIRWGLTIFAIASVGCALAPNVETLWFFRALQGLSGGAGNVVARAMVRDLFEGVAAQRVMAQVQMLFGLAPAVAPIIGGLLLGIHWQIIFIFLAIYAVVTMLAAQLMLPETMPVEKRIPLSPGAVLRGYQVLVKDTQFLRLITAVGANFAGFFLYVLASPVFLIQHLGLNQHQFGYMFVPTVCGMVFGSFLAKRMAGKYSNRALLGFAYSWMLFSVLGNVLLCLLVKPSLWNIVPVASYNIGMALAMPLLSIAALDRHPRIRGTAASGQAFMQMLLATASAGVLIPLLWHHPLWLALGMAGYLAIGFVCVWKTPVWRSAV